MNNFFFVYPNMMYLCHRIKKWIMEKKESGYRKSIDEIEAILAKIENGETDIDDLAAEIKRASQLLHECREKLFVTEQEVKKSIQTQLSEI